MFGLINNFIGEELRFFTSNYKNVTSNITKNSESLTNTTNNSIKINNKTENK
jgi:hypothetical protein